MRKAILVSLSTVLTGAGLALAQPETSPETGDVRPVAYRRYTREAHTEPPLPEASCEGVSAASCASIDAAAEDYDHNAFVGKHGDKHAAGSGITLLEKLGLQRMKDEVPHVPHEPQGRFWLSGEYLYWWTKNDYTGPLVTTGPVESLGVPGNPGVTTLFDTLRHGEASGVRVSAGFANEDGDLGLEGSAFLLETRRERFVFTSDANGAPLLARPVRSAASNQPTGEVIAAPGLFSGSFTIDTTTDLWGADAYLVCPLYCDRTCSIELLGGFRYMELQEDLTLVQNTTILPGGTAIFAGQVLSAPTSLGLAEQFGTRNQFYGGQLGTQGEVRFGNFFLSSIFKLGIGATREVSQIDGATRATDANGVTRVISGGISALPNNSGSNTQDRFALIPEVNVNLGFHLASCVRLYVGYTFMYWSDVIRPGDQAATPVNPALVPTSFTFGSQIPLPRPVQVFSRTDYWAQGLNFGVALRY